MELISATIGILGVIIGWLLNELTTIFRGRPKLCFQMVATPENELTEKEYRVKESFSETMDDIKNGKGLPQLSSAEGSNHQTGITTEQRAEKGITYETFTYHGEKRSNREQ